MLGLFSLNLRLNLFHIFRSLITSEDNKGVIEYFYKRGVKVDEDDGDVD